MSFSLEFSSHVTAFGFPLSCPWSTYNTNSLRFSCHPESILSFAGKITKSGKMIKKTACTNLLLRYLLAFFISYIELQDFIDNFQTLRCTVFNIGLFCCMCCILFKNWTNWGLCYKWQSFLCIICLINRFSTVGSYLLSLPKKKKKMAHK